MTNEVEIVRTLTPYLLAFPHCKANEGTLVIYARALSGYNIGEINAAMLKLMKICKFFPTVAEVCEQIENLRQFVQSEAGVPVVPSADEAWHEAWDFAKKYFIYRPWPFTHPAVEQAVMSFGKSELCLLKPEEMNTARAQFMRIYNAIAERQKDRRTNRETLNALPRRHVDMLVGELAGKLSVLPGGKKEAGA